MGESNEHLAREGRSTASLAWRLRKLVHIPDTVAELARDNPRFVRFRDGQERELGSLVACPIVDDQALSPTGCWGVLCLDCRTDNALVDLEETDLKSMCESVAIRARFEFRRDAASHRAAPKESVHAQNGQ